MKSATPNASFHISRVLNIDVNTKITQALVRMIDIFYVEEDIQLQQRRNCTSTTRFLSHLKLTLYYTEIQ